jgi:hypothetical protein
MVYSTSAFGLGTGGDSRCRASLWLSLLVLPFVGGGDDGDEGGDDTRSSRRSSPRRLAWARDVVIPRWRFLGTATIGRFSSPGLSSRHRIGTGADDPRIGGLCCLATVVWY